MLLREDMLKMLAAEEKRLGVSSPQFMERHREIMEMADQISSRNKKNASIIITDISGGSNPII